VRRSPDRLWRAQPSLGEGGAEDTSERTSNVRERVPAGANARPGRISAPLVIGCGALAHELVALTRRAGFPEVDLTCLPATLHNRPERIPAAVQARIHRAKAAGRDRIFVAYADCGTGGLLDRILENEGVARLEGAHCYEVYAGRAAFAQLAEVEPGTFYLTDFLARNFERLVTRGLGLDRHPELLPLYFGNYTRVLYLAQTDDPALTAKARRGARRLGLRFERRFTGYGELAPVMASLAAAGPATTPGPPGPIDAQSQLPTSASPRGAETLGAVTRRHRGARRATDPGGQWRSAARRGPVGLGIVTPSHPGRAPAPTGPGNPAEAA
jgi:hypothetical protein